MTNPRPFLPVVKAIMPRLATGEELTAEAKDSDDV